MSPAGRQLPDRPAHGPVPHPNDNPTTARTIGFTVNDGDTDSNTDTKAITITPVNDAPVITLSGSTPSYIENGAAVTVDGGLTVADVDDTNLESGDGVDHRRLCRR